jgi:hypothetical protein
MANPTAAGGSRPGGALPVYGTAGSDMATDTMKTEPRIEELPDAWERFERAFDKVMKAKPMPAKKAREPSPKPSEKRGGKRPA